MTLLFPPGHFLNQEGNSGWGSASQGKRLSGNRLAQPRRAPAPQGGLLRALGRLFPDSQRGPHVPT